MCSFSLVLTPLSFLLLGKRIMVETGGFRLTSSLRHLNFLIGRYI